MNVNNWNSIDFDDWTWQRATSFGEHGLAQPWAQYSNVSGIPVSKKCEWIWSADNTSDNEVYLRLTIRTSGDTTPPATPEKPFIP